MTDYDDDDIETMLEECIQELNGSALQFIESLQDYYQRKGMLTEKQIQALVKFHDNIR